MALIKRITKGSPLTFAEGDGNLDYLDSFIKQISSSYATTGSNVFISDQSIIGGALFVNSQTQILGQFVGSQNGYVEFSIQNQTPAPSASADFVVYGDNGTLYDHYIDMGINSSILNPNYTYSGTNLGKANDAYLYHVGGDFRIGTATTSSISQSLYLFANPSGNVDLSITGSRIGIQKSGSLNATLDVNGSAIITGSLTVTGTIYGNIAGSITSASYAVSSSQAATAISSSFATTASYALVTGRDIVVTSPGGIYYIDGVAKPVLTFVPGKTYRFDTSNVSSSHPFQFSLTANGPTPYTYGVTSGSNFTQINVDYNTSQSLYYYCTIHSGMGNAANTLRSENLATIGSNTFTGNQTISGSLILSGSLTVQRSTAILSQVSESFNFVDDTTASGSGIPLGGLYHTSGTIKIRLV
jgi:hypothetical protein